MQNVHSGTISVDQNSSSRGTVWKSSSSSMSEDSGEVVLRLFEVSKLSSLKERWHLTDLAGECVGSTGYWSAWSAVYGVERSMFQAGHVVYVWHFT